MLLRLLCLIALLVCATASVVPSASPSLEAVLNARVELFQAVLATQTFEVESAEAALAAQTSTEVDRFVVELHRKSKDRASTIDEVESFGELVGELKSHLEAEVLAAQTTLHPDWVEPLEAALLAAHHYISDFFIRLEAALLAARTSTEVDRFVAELLENTTSSEVRAVESLEAELLAARTSTEVDRSDEVESLEILLQIAHARTSLLESLARVIQAQILTIRTNNSRVLEELEAKLLAARRAVLDARAYFLQAVLATRTHEVESLKAQLAASTPGEVESLEAELLAARTARTSKVKSLEAVLDARVDIMQAVLNTSRSEVESVKAALDAAGNSEPVEVKRLEAALLAARTAVLHARVDLLQAVLAARTHDVESVKAALLAASTPGEVESLEAELLAARTARTSEVKSLEAVLHARVFFLQAVLDTQRAQEQYNSSQAFLDAFVSEVESKLYTQSVREHFYFLRIVRDAVESEVESLKAQLDAGTSEEVESLEAKLLAARTAEVELLQAELAEQNSEVESLQAARLAASTSNSDGVVSFNYDFFKRLDAALQAARRAVLDARVESFQAILATRTSEVESVKAARGNLTCGEVKFSYNASGCCVRAGGHPEKRFTFVDGR